MRQSLVVFIDCFPEASASTDFLSSLPGRAGIRPGFGYSVNILAELFAGKTPDDLGTFNIFGYNPDNLWLAPWRRALQLLSPLQHVYPADRIAHRLLTRGVGFTGNIPFRHIGYFEPSGMYPFDGAFPHPTIFSGPHFQGSRIFHSQLRGVRPPHRDAVLLKKAMESVTAGESLFLSLSDLDAQAHAYGVGSPEFQRRIEEYDQWLGALIQRFLEANPEAYVAVLSDHGAANTHATHDLQVEKKLGRAKPGRFMYFLDDTLARFWVQDRSLLDEVMGFLVAEPHGHLLTEEERNEYGLRSRSFGDFIWVVDEGYGISPSFLGRGLTPSLHGYHPELESQRALFLSSDVLPRRCYTSIEAHHVLREKTGMASDTGSGGKRRA